METPNPTMGQTRQAACQAPTLPQVLKSLRGELALVTAELKTMPPDAWLNVRGRDLANREEELHITLDVLQRLAAPPRQIEEPGA